MKKWFLLFLAVAASASAQEINETCAELRLSTGRILTNTRVTLFDGENFHVENSNGASQVPWASMPEEWRAKFPLDPRRALWVEKEKQRKVRYARDVATYNAAQAAVVQTSKPERSAFGTVMELPRHNLETTLADLKIGITSEKLLRILGNPLHINGTQWVYSRGYVYVENGVVTAMQNRYGGVFGR